MKQKIFTAISLVALIICIAASIFIADVTSAQVDRTKKPSPGPVPHAAFPPSSESKLSNGIRVLVVEDHKQPLVYIRTMIQNGSAVDGKNIGAASAVATLLEKGTSSRTADQIAQQIDFYGSNISAGASADALNISTSSLKDDLDKILPVYSDVIRNPIFPQEEVDKYISNTLSNLQAQKQQPGEMGRRLGRKLIYGEHPYGAYETEETVKGLTKAALVDWHKRNFGANDAVIAVVGDVTTAEVLPMLEKYFGNWSASTPDKPNFTPLTDVKGTSIYLIDRPGSVQSTIRLQRLGLQRGDPQFDEAEFLDDIFSGGGSFGFISRLFQNIREKHGYTYSPGGALTESKDRGSMIAVAEVRNVVTDSALDQMLLEYRRLSTQEVPASELAIAKSAVTGSYLMSLTEPGAISARALDVIEYNLPKDYFQTYAERISRLTAKDLKETGKKVFPANDIAVIVTGDAKEIQHKLERFGDVKVYSLDLLPAGPGNAFDTTGLSLDEVLQAYWKAIGKSALDTIHDRTQQGTLTVSAGGQKMSGTVSEVEEAGNKKYEKVQIAGMTIERQINGEKAWRTQNGATVAVEGSELKNELADAIFNPEIHLQDAGSSVKLLGKKQMPGGKQAYVLNVSHPGVPDEQWYIDTKTYMMVQQVRSNQDGEMISTYSDFQPYGGVVYPRKVQVSGPQSVTVQITSIKHNTHPSEAIFTR